LVSLVFFFFFQAADGIRDFHVTGVQTCALPISPECSIPPSVYCCPPCSPPAPWPCPVSSCSATPCACGALERAGSSQWRSAPALRPSPHQAAARRSGARRRCPSGPDSSRGHSHRGLRRTPLLLTHVMAFPPARSMLEIKNSQPGRAG